MFKPSSFTSTRHKEPTCLVASAVLRGKASLEMDSENTMLKRMPVVMPMDVVGRRVMVLIFMLLSLVTFRCFAEGAVPSVQICDVIKNIDAFDGRLIELHTDIRITMHGRYLVGNECGGLGSLVLVIKDEQYKNKEVKTFVRKIYSNGTRSGLVLIGYPSKAPFNHSNGSFVLQGVVNSRAKSLPSNKGGVAN